ncbi:PLDc N-terminal domain-containing protein [Halomicrobium sp. IBSBa]|uniref:PLDc N-terminal domain-containing protein n=1 Tax=unclassified Halomicrobium TaxID=2610901 RepID=UPI001ABF1371|nr:PLDc N-terminal domain-containing protein [Halomicrobium sp. IBSBa]MBO4246841.1 PLDc N-terminal domain-containing protein [Halomicrobium sp. IBSBa]
MVPLQAGFFLVFLLFGLAITALWVWVSYWVYTDATDRGMDTATLWAVVTFVGGVIGLLIYILVREDSSASQAVSP